MTDEGFEESRESTTFPGAVGTESIEWFKLERSMSSGLLSLCGIRAENRLFVGMTNTLLLSVFEGVNVFLLGVHVLVLSEILSLCLLLYTEWLCSRQRSTNFSSVHQTNFFEK